MKWMFVLGGTLGSLIDKFQLSSDRQIDSIQRGVRQNSINSPLPPINPNEPIQLCVVNQSNVEIVAVLTEPFLLELNLQPSELVDFHKFHRNYPLPIDLTLYAKAQKTTVSLGVKVVNNELTIRVTTQKAGQSESRSIHVDKDGTIYLYEAPNS